MNTPMFRFVVGLGLLAPSVIAAASARGQDAPARERIDLAAVKQRIDHVIMRFDARLEKIETAREAYERQVRLVAYLDAAAASTARATELAAKDLGEYESAYAPGSAQFKRDQDKAAAAMKRLEKVVEKSPKVGVPPSPDALKAAAKRLLELHPNRAATPGSLRVNPNLRFDESTLASFKSIWRLAAVEAEAVKSLGELERLKLDRFKAARDSETLNESERDALRRLGGADRRLNDLSIAISEGNAREESEQVQSELRLIEAGLDEAESLWNRAETERRSRSLRVARERLAEAVAPSRTDK